MNWTDLPVFEDANLRKKERVHNTFGGKVVEILYGAKDAEGNSIHPDARSTEDGHGRWYGIEVDGKYCMFSWQKPASEGGEVTYGTDAKEDALETMENDVRTKLDIARQAEVLSRTFEGDDPEADLNALKEKWNALPDWGTPKEKEYQERFDNAVASFGANSIRRDENAAEKQSIIDRAQELIESKDWKATREEFNELYEQLRSAGSAGNTADDNFRKAFNDARRKFDSNREEYFSNIDTMRAQAGEKKKEIIEKAKEVVANVPNFREAGDKMNELFQEWKAAGSAGRDDDDNLWEQFTAIRNEFREKRNAYFEERNAHFAEVAEKKNEIINKVKELVEKNDFSKEITDQIKALDNEWKSLGYSGRDNENNLWEQFKELKDKFWSAKREKTNEHLTNIAERKTGEAQELQKKIDDLKFKVEITPNLDMKHELDREIEDAENELKAVEDDIASIQKKISK